MAHNNEATNHPPHSNQEPLDSQSAQNQESNLEGLLSSFEDGKMEHSDSTSSSMEGEAENSDNPIDKTLSLTQSLQSEIADLKDKYLRLFSEFDNFRRRTAKEKNELRLTASSDLMVKILEVLDDLERAIKANEDSADLHQVKEGLSLVQGKFIRTLQQQGLKEMQAIGEAFNADIHESITSIPAPSPEQVGKIIDVVQKGYFLHEKPIRFAKVIIGQ